jgi:hypothetical protein
MNKFNTKRLIALMLVTAMVSLHTGRAEAMLAPADGMGIMSARRATDTQKVQTFLEQKQVSQKLAGYGFTPTEISSRLSSLTDSELHNISTRIDQQNPAADGGGIVVTVLVIGILALLFVYLLKRV